MSANHAASLQYHAEGWAVALAKDCAAAVRTIHLSALSLVPPTPNGHGSWPELWRALQAAASRGVYVHVWLPAPQPAHPATRGNIGAGRACAEAGINIHYVQGPRLLHAKTAVIDGTILFVGSGNFTAAAAHHNHEHYLRADCPAIAQQIVLRLLSLA